MPKDVINDLKRIAPLLGFSGYQPLIRAYIGQGLRVDLERLEGGPDIAKVVEKELSGYLSLRMKRFRIIYKVKPDDLIVEIHYVGHRKDIYELFKENLERE